ncbi:MAG: DUF4491 family protein [Bacteroidota bacterium]|nr:DUF4491 family protein [Bacteroidota bacterium]
MNFYGLLIGLISFLIIGMFHPLVIKMEYYFGKRSWWALLIPAIVFIILSFVTSAIYSIIFGVLSFACIWSIVELFKQHERVLKGQAKRNPKRNYNE